MEYHETSLGEFLRRGLTEDDNYVPITEREKRILEYRLSNKYRRTLWECIRLDLKVIKRVLKRRFF